MKLDSDTNNTSLALAFELPDGRVLLFPGDAQVGNWESWHADADDHKRVWQIDDHAVTAEMLLNRTVLYKVGHHGSHNATLREKGLEMMTDPALTAMVPVDVYIAHEKKQWTKMPFTPLMARLREKTEDRSCRRTSRPGLPPKARGEWPTRRPPSRCPAAGGEQSHARSTSTTSSPSDPTSLRSRHGRSRAVHLLCTPTRQMCHLVFR